MYQLAMHWDKSDVFVYLAVQNSVRNGKAIVFPLPAGNYSNCTVCGVIVGSSSDPVSAGKAVLEGASVLDIRLMLCNKRKELHYRKFRGVYFQKFNPPHFDWLGLPRKKIRPKHTEGVVWAQSKGHFWTQHPALPVWPYLWMFIFFIFCSYLPTCTTCY